MKTKQQPSTHSHADIYERVTERILELLEQGVKPWEPSHFAKVGFPRNFSTGKAYRGANVFLLGMQRYASPWWLTYIQAKELGGQVKKGEKGSLVIKYGEYSKDEDQKEGEEATRRGYLKGYVVFNACQIEGVAFPAAPAPEPLPISEQCARARQIVAGMPKPPAIHEGRFTRAFYRVATD